MVYLEPESMCLVTANDVVLPCWGANSAPPKRGLFEAGKDRKREGRKGMEGAKEQKPEINFWFRPCVLDPLGRRVICLPNLSGAVCISVVLAELI